MASLTDSTWLGKPLATKFLSRGIQTKETSSKELAKAIMSETTPYKSEFASSELTNLTSVAESDSQRSRGRLSSLHFKMVSRSARPSAGVAKDDDPVVCPIVHPRPAICLLSLQAASVLTTMHRSAACWKGIFIPLLLIFVLTLSPFLCCWDGLRNNFYGRASSVIKAQIVSFNPELPKDPRG